MDKESFLKTNQSRSLVEELKGAARHWPIWKLRETPTRSSTRTVSWLKDKTHPKSSWRRLNCIAKNWEIIFKPVEWSRAMDACSSQGWLEVRLIRLLIWNRCNLYSTISLTRTRTRYLTVSRVKDFWNLHGESSPFPEKKLLEHNYGSST